MRVEAHPYEVRQLVVEAFEVLGADFDDFDDLEENILIHAGRYTARSYRTDAMLAMWLVDAGLVQFYDADGNMLRTINLSTELEPVKLAA